MSGVLCTAMVVSAEGGVMLCLALKPLVDAFWSHKALVLGIWETNLQTVVGVAVPATICAMGLCRRWMFDISPLNLLIVAYVTLSLYGVVVSPARDAAIADFFRIASPFALYWVGTQGVRSQKRLLMCGAVLAAYGLVPAANAVLELVGIVNSASGAEPMPDGVIRVSGLYHHPLDIATRCSIGIPFAFYLAHHLCRKEDRLFSWLYGASLAGFALVPSARSAIFATTAQVFLLLWTAGRRALSLVVIPGAAAVVFLAAPLRTVVQEGVRPLWEGNVYELGTGRAFLFAAQASGYKAASPVQKVVGRGLHGTQRLNIDFSPARDPVLEKEFEEGYHVGPHNQVLRVLGESGAFGLAVFIGMYVLIVRHCRWVMRNVAEPGARGFGRAALIALGAMGVYSLSITPLDRPSLTWPLWFAIGVVEQLRRTELSRASFSAGALA